MNNLKTMELIQNNMNDPVMNLNPTFYKEKSGGN